MTKYLKAQCSHCQGRVEFPAEAAGMTTDCPHCGKTTELLLLAPPDEPVVPRRTVVWTITGVLILLLGLAAGMGALKRAQRWAAQRRPVEVSPSGAGPSLGAAASEQGEAQQKTKDPGQPGAAAPGDGRAPSSVATAQSSQAISGFRVSEIALEKSSDSSLIYAVGTVINPAARQRFGVKIELDLLDGAGRKVGAASDYQQVMEPRSEWHFKALVVNAKAKTAKVTGIKEQ